YPARSAGRAAPARRGRHPLVLVAHGYCGFRTNYEYLSVPLASWGFLVAAPDFPGINRADCDAGVPPGDIIGDPPRDLAFLRGAFHDRSGPARALARLVRGRHAGLVGHSLGGAAVVHASLADPDLTAVVALAAVAGSAQGQAFHGLRRRGGGLEPVHGHGIVPGDGASGGIGQRRGEPDADGRLLRLVEIRCDLDRLADHDLHPRLLARLARRGRTHVLAPLDEAAREAPPARAELPGRAPDQEHAPRGVADDARGAHARVGEEDEAAARAARPRDTAPYDAHE